MESEKLEIIGLVYVFLMMTVFSVIIHKHNQQLLQTLVNEVQNEKQADEMDSDGNVFGRTRNS